MSSSTTEGEAGGRADAGQDALRRLERRYRSSLEDILRFGGSYPHGPGAAVFYTPATTMLAVQGLLAALERERLAVGGGPSVPNLDQAADDEQDEAAGAAVASALDALFGDFDARLAAVHGRLDRILERGGA